MSETIEQHEHAEKAAEEGRVLSALLIACLAAGLAFTEQGAQHANTRMSASAIAATDLWAQYQAKSIRANEAKDLATVIGTAAPASPDREQAIATLRADVQHFQTDKDSIAADAKRHEMERDTAHEHLEAYDNAAAALQLAIVLTTASVITRSRLLTLAGLLLGIAGGALGITGYLRPELAVF